MAPGKKPKRRKLPTQVITAPGEEGKYEAWEPFGKIYIERYSRIPGTGSIDTVKRKGYTYLRARVWVENAKGVRVRKPVYGKTHAELTRKLAALKESPATSDVKKLRIEDFLTEHFLPAVKLRAKAKTYAGYEQAIRLHINPQLGKAKLVALESKHVNAWLKDLDAKPRAKQNAFVTLKAALNHATHDDVGILDRNPIGRTKAPRAEKAEQHILTLAETKKLLVTARDHFPSWHALLYLAIETSMRQGELFALTWRDVDLKQGFAFIRQGVGTAYDDETKSGYRREITSPKTPAARRRSDLSAEAVAILKAHRKDQTGPNPEGLVFPNEAGSFIHASNFSRRVWAPLLKKAELPHVKFHSLRHSGNSILVQQGLSLPLLQRRLGHSTPQVTMAVYSHAGAEEGRRGAGILGGLLGGTTRGTTGSNGSRKARAKAREKAR